MATARVDTYNACMQVLQASDAINTGGSLKHPQHVPAAPCLTAHRIPADCVDGLSCLRASRLPCFSTHPITRLLALPAVHGHLPGPGAAPRACCRTAALRPAPQPGRRTWLSAVFSPTGQFAITQRGVWGRMWSVRVDLGWSQ